MKKITLLSVITFLFMTAMSFAQGVTTSSINGRVLDNNDGPLPGANIIATHVPTGSVYGAVTDFDGFYRLTNMKSGGPYTLTITYVGFQDFKKEGFSLSLGESKRVSTKMVESANALDEIVITAQNNGIFNSNKTGSETSISERDINTLPTVSRSLADFARVTPSAQLTEGNDVTIVATGHLVWEALQAAEQLETKGITAEVINIHTIKPLDEDIILKSIAKTGCIVTAEEHNKFGGLGESVARCLATNTPTPQEFVAVNDSFGESATPAQLMEKYELNDKAIIKAVEKVISRK